MGRNPELSLVVRIDNHDQIATVYGLATVTALGHAIKQRLKRFPNLCCSVASDVRQVKIDVFDLDAICAPSTLGASAELAAEILVRTIALQPYGIGDALLSVAPSIAPGSGIDETFNATPSVHLIPSHQFVTGGRSYRYDAQCAADLYEALCEGRTRLYRQPVRHASIAGSILYHECLLRVADGAGNMCSPGEYIPAIERLGLTRAFDAHIVASVIAELQTTPDVVLAANISAQSAIDDIWWHSIKTALRSAPDVAARLIIEITETAELPSLESAVAFVATMHELGCRIALDDFGVGNASLQRVAALEPEMVKIDAFFARWAEDGLKGHGRIEHLVGLLGSLVPIVVIEGVETGRQSKLMANAGAAWQQGYYHGPPEPVGMTYP